MISKEKISEIITAWIGPKDYFIVDITVDTKNRVSVFFDSPLGITIDQCASLNHYIRQNLNHDNEDYELQVSSPGLDHPLKVIGQYYKNIGKKVEVVPVSGVKVSGKLLSVTDTGIELEERIAGIKKQVSFEVIKFNFTEIKTTKVIPDFSGLSKNG